MPSYSLSHGYACPAPSRREPTHSMSIPQKIRFANLFRYFKISGCKWGQSVVQYQNKEAVA